MMSNSVKGEVGFEALGKSWRLKLGTAALIELEERHGRGIQAIMMDFANAGDAGSDVKMISLLQSIIVAALRRFHPDVTSGVACDIMDEVGIEKIGELMNEAVIAAFPSARKDAVAENPTQQKR